MSENRGSCVRALLAIGFALFVIGFVVIRSGAIESAVETKMVSGKLQEKKVWRFTASKIPLYLKSVVTPVTGQKAIEND